MNLKPYFLTFCALWITLSSSAQTVKDVFDKSVPVTWFGLDFTAAKFIGDRDKFGSLSDVKFLIKSWNDLIEKEKSNFNIEASFNKEKVDYKIDVARDHNEELEITGILAVGPIEHLLTKEDIKEVVKSYNFSSASSDLGLIFIVESFNKLQGKASVWVTFVNTKNNEVVFTDKMVDAPGGNGLRNYWAGSIKNILEKIKGKQTVKWKKENGLID